MTKPSFNPSDEEGEESPSRQPGNPPARKGALLNEDFQRSFPAVWTELVY
jgi:hypothetical protein